MKIMYFAWLRERLNKDEEFVSPPENIKTVGDLIDWMSVRDEAFQFAFEKRDLIRAAIDDDLVEHDHSLANANTVAFFPPMTGG